MSAQTINLRDYQIEFVDQLRECLSQGINRPILYAPTGAGKTEMAFRLIQQAIQKRSTIWFVADRITLVHQTANRAWDYGIIPGIRQGPTEDGVTEPLQIWSAQTLEKKWKQRDRRWVWPDLWIIDECHTQRKDIIEMIKESGRPAIGLTATPLTPGLKDLSLIHI